MNPNINLHIDSIVLDGIDLAPGQAELLQQTVADQLTTMITQQFFVSAPFSDSDNRAEIAGNSIHLSGTASAISLGPQLAKAIYANIPRSQLGSSIAHGGQS